MFHRKYIVIAAAVVMQACLGGIYAWSALVPALEKDFGYTSAMTQLVFGTCICVFTISQVLTGRMQDRRGPRAPAMLSGVLLGAGYLLASAGGGNFYLLWLAVGLIGGLGIGFGYVVPIATSVKWFPQHKGLVCGLAVAGYGGGAIVLANVVPVLLSWGWDVLSIFGAIGIVYGLVVVAAGSQMVAPPTPPEWREPVAFDRRALLGDRRFWALACGIFCATLPGLAIIGNLKPIGLSLGLADATATLAISLLAVGNASGRIVWGLVFDRLGGRRSIMLSFAAIAVSVAAMTLPGGGAAGFLASAVLVGFCYGGCFAIYPAQVARVYGVGVLGGVYPLVLMSHGLSAPFGSTLGGWGKDLSGGSFIPSLLVAMLVPLIGLAVFYTLSGREKP